MSKTEELEYRLKLICELIDQNFFEYNEKEKYYYIPDKFEEYKYTIQEMFYIAGMGEIDYK